MLMDMQKKRLKHLMANAILELWKKETGSLSSVLIEGTICITAGTGKTTVVQVCDKFAGSIPEAEDDIDHGFSSPSTTMPSDSAKNMMMFTPPFTPYGHMPHEYGYRHPMHMGAYMDRFSPAFLVSPHSTHRSQSPASRDGSSRPSSAYRDGSSRPSSAHRERSRSRSCDRRNNTAEHSSPVKEEKVEREIEEKSMEHEQSVCRETSPEPQQTSTPFRQSVPVLGGTGFYTPESGGANVSADSGKGNSPENLSYRFNEETSYRDENDNYCTDKQQEKSSKTVITETQQQESSSSKDLMHDDRQSHSAPPLDGLDLTKKKDVDLALSDPQSYTAQVRDVIRQRLAARANSMSALSDSQGKTNPGTPISVIGSTSEKSDKSAPQTPAEVAKTSIPAPTWPLAMMGNIAAHPVLPIHRIAAAHLPPHSATVLNLSGSPHPTHPHMGPGGMPLHHDMLRSKFPNLLGASPHGTNGLRHPHGVPYMGMGHIEGMVDRLSGPGLASPCPSDEGSEKDSTLSNGEQRVYRCEYCSKTFLFKSKYHEHLPVHTNIRPFQCHLCSRTYKYKYDLRVHLRTHMGIPTKSTVCPFCTAKFESNKMLRLHIKESHKDKHKISEEECTNPLDHTPPAI